MPHCLSTASDLLLAIPAGVPSIHLVLIITLLFTVVMVRVGRKDP